MSNTTPIAHPGNKLLPGDRLEEIDDVLYKFSQMCALFSAFAYSNTAVFTDGLRLETYATVFGWIGDELEEVRASLGELHKELKAA